MGLGKLSSRALEASINATDCKTTLSGAMLWIPIPHKVDGKWGLCWGWGSVKPCSSRAQVVLEPMIFLTHTPLRESLFEYKDSLKQDLRIWGSEDAGPRRPAPQARRRSSQQNANTSIQKWGACWKSFLGQNAVICWIEPNWVPTQ